MIEKFISSISSDICGEAALEIINKTSHMVRARSVAIGAGKCIFAARLAEAFGAISDFTSILPGKGILTHQILALALPMIYYSRYKWEFIKGALSRDTIRNFVERSRDLLREEGIVNFEKLKEKQVTESVENAISMINVLSNYIETLMNKIGLDPDHTLAYTELMLYSYRFHIVGVIDALFEDYRNRKALIIEWKTEGTPQVWEIAQGYVYALLEAERLGFDDPVAAVRDNEDVVPIVIRPRGQIRIYSIADKFRTARAKVDKNDLIEKILLAAEHLVLTLTNYKRYVERNIQILCSIRGRYGHSISVFRRKPNKLPGYNPLTRDRYPCNACVYKEACKFYIASYEEWTFLDRLAQRTRYAIYDVRENALRPLKEFYVALASFYRKKQDLNMLRESIDKLGGVLGGSGNRIDYFESAKIDPQNYIVVLERKLKNSEKQFVPPKLRTVREGKPVLILFYQPFISNPLMWISFHGRVEEIEVIGGSTGGEKLRVYVMAPNMASRMQLLLINEVLSYNKHMLNYPLALEINVDLTQLELQAVDAFHRASKKLLKEEGLYSVKEDQVKLLDKIVKENHKLMFAILFVGQLLKKRE